MADNKEKIKQSFSKSAGRYDRYAELQRETAGKLFVMLEGEYGRILDIGSGTGELVGMLAEKYPLSKVVGIDIAEGMIEYANAKVKNHNSAFICGDGERIPFKDKEFDLAVSSLSLQWMDPGKVFAEAARVLRPGGRFYFSTFGARTLCELKEKKLSVNAFPSKDWIEKSLRRHFKGGEVYWEISNNQFNVVFELFSYLKKIGAQIPLTLRGGGLMTKRRMNSLFSGKFSATYEICYSTCEK